MEVLGGAGSWTATPSDLVKIVDSLDRDQAGLAPAVVGDPRADAPAGATAGATRRRPVATGSG